MADHRVAGKLPPPARVTLSTTGALRRARLDGKPGARARAEFGEEAEQTLHEEVFGIEQIVGQTRFVAFEDAGGGFDILAAQRAAHVAGCDAHARVVADALDFSG